MDKKAKAKFEEELTKRLENSHAAAMQLSKEGLAAVFVSSMAYLAMVYPSVYLEVQSVVLGMLPEEKKGK